MGSGYKSCWSPYWDKSRTRMKSHYPESVFTLTYLCSIVSLFAGLTIAGYPNNVSLVMITVPRRMGKEANMITKKNLREEKEKYFRRSG